MKERLQTMLTTKITYIASDGTQFSEKEKARAIEYESKLEKLETDLLTEVVCFDETWQKTDFEGAFYVWVKSPEGIQALNHFCKEQGIYPIWETDSGPDLEEKAGLYAWDEANEEWFNVEDSIANLKEILENFSKNS
jgi:hypothetical protein